MRAVLSRVPLSILLICKERTDRQSLGQMLQHTVQCYVQAGKLHSRKHVGVQRTQTEKGGRELEFIKCFLVLTSSSGALILLQIY
jgi:hypothetical protein